MTEQAANAGGAMPGTQAFEEAMRSAWKMPAFSPWGASAPTGQAPSPTFESALRSLSGLKIDPAELLAIQTDYLREAAQVWNQRLSADAAATPIKDRRFAGEQWLSNPVAGYAAAVYLLNARTLARMAEAVQGDEKTRARVRFAVQQWIDAAAPSNYLALNPEALQKAISTQGESLVSGVRNLIGDLRQGHVSQTDESVFEVGRNVATSEGAVVFENEYFQLLEYKPLTPKVHARPMLFVPPCINKFYILDLQPENSLIRYTVEQGHRVFVVSWRNPDDGMAARTWDDYVEHGVIQALRTVQDISGSAQVNALGFCVGGTLLACALAVLAARGEQPAASVTLLTTFLDFSRTGVLDLFIDEDMVRLREMSIGAQAAQGPKLLKGKELATTFSFLRPNELVWNYVVGNYLKGELPPPFDLLYWNSDSTNLPGPMYCWYLRNTYLEDKLKQPGALTVCGESVDLRTIQAPVYLYASREDHIVPWESAYLSTGILSGPKRFVLGASGHIAGVINPPAKKKRNYWLCDAQPDSAAEWFAQAQEHPGSWWPDWAGWLQGHAGALKAAPKAFGNKTHPAIEPAPGRYVQQKA
ncbi:class I poly(R)-hydroxyalkanoic acid synthase [Sphaerotilus hippei]|nr:class I poly(R)-hydroxyalkanoic acid synthase [Sphaerotilus hippei]